MKIELSISFKKKKNSLIVLSSQFKKLNKSKNVSIIFYFINRTNHLYTCFINSKNLKNSLNLKAPTNFLLSSKLYENKIFDI